MQSIQKLHSDILLSVLKSEVEQTFGRSLLTYKDCMLLSEELFAKTKVSVNANTLRRLYGLVKTPYKPSIATLNILARYCGYDSIDDVPVQHQPKEEALPKESMLHFLINLFREIPVNDISNQTFFTLSKHTILFFNRNPSLAHEFQNHIAKTKNGQYFYFERFINMDKLNGYYGEGLRRYISEKNTEEAENFGYSLLVMRYWLTKEYEKMEYAAKHIRCSDVTNIQKPAISARNYAAHLYLANAFGASPESVIEHVQQYHLRLRTQKDEIQSFPFFELIISEALVLTGYYNEALYYINFAYENYMRNLAYLEFGYYKTLELLKGIALCKVGQKKEAEKIINSFNVKELCFLSKKYNNILYYIVCDKIRKINVRDRAHLKKLIDETGFSRFATYAQLQQATD